METHARSHLYLQPISDPFLDRYLKELGDDLLGSVGAYQIEGFGV